jgi:peptidoglycan/xylan/chitin deacetylase (PgdA/CDA1 family)
MSYKRVMNKAAVPSMILGLVVAVGLAFGISTRAEAGACVAPVFDDGSHSHSLAARMVEEYGFHITFAVVSQRMIEAGPFDWHLSVDAVRALRDAGHEIACHGRTHAALTELNSSQKADEILGCRQQLRDTVVDPLTFVYPYGLEDEKVIEIVRAAGFIAARGVQPGLNDQSTDRYRLYSYSVMRDTTPVEVLNWITQAQEQEKLLILTFHEVVENPSEISITPQNLRDHLTTIALSGVPVVTLTEGLTSQTCN